jgi:hypothetical protein
MTWLPIAIAAGFVVAVLSLAIGRVRHDTRKTIALNTVGYPLFLIGLGAASEVGELAFWAAAAASLGSLLFTMADHDRRAARPSTAGTLVEN